MELSINNVTKQFKDKKAVNDISFSMGNGVYGLLGVNGAGKTTLMRMLCTLTTPDCGTITWDGKISLRWELRIARFLDICHRILGIIHI